MNRRRILLLAVAMLALVAAGCGAQLSGDVSSSTMTEAQRDSTIARSQIPGAKTVANTFKFAHKTSRLTADVDSLER
jgi:hypothetical protein